MMPAAPAQLDPSQIAILLSTVKRIEDNGVKTAASVDDIKDRVTSIEHQMKGFDPAQLAVDRDRAIRIQADFVEHCRKADERDAERVKDVAALRETVKKQGDKLSEMAGSYKVTGALVTSIVALVFTLAAAFLK